MSLERVSEHPRCWSQRLWWVFFLVGLVVAYFVMRNFQMNYLVFFAGLAALLAVFSWGGSVLGRQIDKRWRSEKGLRRQHRRLLRATQRWLRRILRNRAQRLETAVLNRLEHTISEVGEILERSEATAEELLRERRRVESFIDEHLASMRKGAVREYLESIGTAVLIALALRAFVIEAFQIPSGSMVPTLRVGDHIFVNKLSYGIRLPLLPLKLFGWRIPPVSLTWSAPRRGDVIVFITPENESEDYIKRVVAVPGDTVEVKEGMLWLNGQMVTLNGGEAFTYNDLDEDGKVRGQVSAKLFQESLGDGSHAVLRRACRYDYDCPALALPQCDLNSGECQAQTSGCSMETGLCRQSNFGPYNIPPGRVFVMGDNRDNSRDSRVWGTVPYELIKGRAIFIWWSYREDMVQWPRMFTAIR